MRLQNRFRTGLDIARTPRAIMRKDMAEYDADPASTPSRWAAGTASSASRS
jgi:isocitrate lyase